MAAIRNRIPPNVFVGNPDEERKENDSTVPLDDEDEEQERGAGEEEEEEEGGEEELEEFEAVKWNPLNTTLVSTSYRITELFAKGPFGSDDEGSGVGLMFDESGGSPSEGFSGGSPGSPESPGSSESAPADGEEEGEVSSVLNISHGI